MGFGILYEELNDGVGQFTTGIVIDKENKIVEVLNIETIQFLGEAK